MDTLKVASIQDEVLRLFGRGGSVHLDTFRKELQLTDKQVRSAIDGLRRRPGIRVNWNGTKTWCLK